MPTAAAQSDFLLARARRGDLEAVEALFRDHSAGVYSLARRLTGSVDDAEDIVQETFVEVARSIGSFRGDGPLAAWVRRIAASKGLMRIRSRRAAGESGDLDADALPAPLATGAPERLDLEAALARLPETARAVVWLHDVEGYTHEEIAQMMGQTPSFSKSKLARAHARLREWLEGREDARAPLD